jgi:hypothetical protein
MRVIKNLWMAACVLALAVSSAPAAWAQVTVVNMIPAAQSNEINRDSEPNLAVDPAQPLRMAGSAFTADPGGSADGVLFLSIDGGANWTITAPVLTGSVPGNCFSAFCDITLRFGGSTGRLYLSDLTADGGGNTVLRVSRINDIFGAVVVDQLEGRTGAPGQIPDQPYIEATTVLGGSGTGSDRAFIGINDLGVAGSQTATVDHTLNATPPSPAGFSSARIESRVPPSQDGAAVRAAIHADGTVYAAFFGWRSASTTDIVVVRDDNWGSGATPFTALTDSGDSLAGQRVVTGVTFADGIVGNQRAGVSQLSIAVDPTDSDIVYVAWGDGPSGAMTLHVRRSTDRGQTWSADLRSIATAINPALAVNSQGKAGFLYQQLGNPGTGNRWRTHVEISADAFVTPPTDLLLADLADQKGFGYTGPNPIGDYVHLMAAGRDFYGIFSSINTPDNASFPNNVIYHRHADFATQTLFADAAHTMSVQASIDPFFFHVADAPSDSDFYVRDWTDAGGHDEGQEPSTHSVFYTTSDVWNRLTDVAGAFVGDAPVSELPQEAASGPNFAYVRVGRKAAASMGAPAVDVTAHFLYADFGLGVPYADMGPGTDPVLTFNAADTEKTLAAGNGFPWDLPVVHSNHICMAVEISTPQDPFTPPGLTGSVPGWPTTDLAVLNDNNKAQRNIIYPGATDNSDVSTYALIRNAATFRRTVDVRMDADPAVLRRVGGIRLAACGLEPAAFKPGGVLRFPAMEPGEERMLRIDLHLSPAGQGGPLPLQFTEMRDGDGVNGFAVAVRPVPLRDLVRETLVRQLQVFSRLDAAFKTPKAREILKLTRQALRAPRISDASYLDVLKKSAALFRGLISGPPSKAPCGPDPDADLRLLVAAIKPKNTTALVSAHARYLESLDAAATLRQHADGNTADILQTVQWGRDLVKRLAALGKVESRSRYISRSDAFIEAYGRRKVKDADYPQLLSESRGFFEEVARTLAGTAPALQKDLAALAQGPQTPAALQKAHRAFLLDLSHLEK